MRLLPLLIALLTFPAAAQDEVPEGKEPAADPSPTETELESWQEDRIGFGGIPAVNYNADEGFGFGVVGFGGQSQDQLHWQLLKTAIPAWRAAAPIPSQLDRCSRAWRLAAA